MSVSSSVDRGSVERRKEDNKNLRNTFTSSISPVKKSSHLYLELDFLKMVKLANHLDELIQAFEALPCITDSDETVFIQINSNVSVDND